jgi:hypothetical protein
MVKYFSLGLLLFSFLSCKDAKLVLPKTQNNSNNLKLNGYYYHSPIGIDSNITLIDFFYYNGISLKFGGMNSKNLTIVDQNIKIKTKVEKNKVGWGLFIIKNDNIQIENWEPTEGGRKTSKREGTIINDTTFVIKKFFSAYTQKEYLISETYKFRQFSPKPDSTNKWIK